MGEIKTAYENVRFMLNRTATKAQCFGGKNGNVDLGTVYFARREFVGSADIHELRDIVSFMTQLQEKGTTNG